MAISSPLVTDPSLQSVLAAADLARTQSLAILDLLDAHHASSADLDPTAQQLELSAQQKKLTAHLANLRGLNRKAVLAQYQARNRRSEAGDRCAAFAAAELVL
jgi:acetolactate synthase small subunit